jgi:predicted DNA-binding ribbon-helix-helix protein
VSGLEKRSITIGGHRTSLALEPEFWAVLEAIAAARDLSLPRLVGEIDAARLGDQRALASALRVYALTNKA